MELISTLLNRLDRRRATRGRRLVLLATIVGTLSVLIWCRLRFTRVVCGNGHADHLDWLVARLRVDVQLWL